MVGAVAEGQAAAAVRMDLGRRSHDILIGPGLIADAGNEIAARLPGARAAVVCDETVAGLHLEALTDSLAAAGIDCVPVVLPEGERTKSFEHLTAVCDAVLDARLERGDVIVALGGGVIGDLAGFAAAIVRRGMRLVQVPTTLLAQVDSAVGGKTGINTRHGKNLIGAFHQPALVLADPRVLNTLTSRAFRAGYAEVVKYGLIDRPDFFAWLETCRQAVFGGGPERLQAIAASCRAKADLVTADEREEDGRALLNLGHTFAHALEAATGFDGDRLVHGEAVAIGLVLAHRFSARLGLADREDGERVCAHLKAAGLPTDLRDIPGGALSAEALMTRIAHDKKVRRGRLTFVLTRGIGKAFVAEDVAAQDVRGFLDEARRQ